MSERESWYDNALGLVAVAGWVGAIAIGVGLIVYAPLVWNLGELVWWFS